LLLQQQILLHLSLIEDIGPGTIAHFLANIEDISQLYQARANDLIHCYDITPARAEKIVQGLADSSLLATELELLAKNPPISVITLIDDRYPSILKSIHLPPPVLYAKGAEFTTDKGLAIVGARAANSYAQEVVNAVIPDLVAKGFTIVSGGARGVDTMAHQATIKAQGKTRVILGSGLLRLYPPENRRLFEQIAQEGGTLISPYPLLMDPLPGNFPARNRIIAGLSIGCVVVQAALKSGALISAKYALDQGKEVFAVPGSVFDELSLGCHALIRQGATTVSKSADILEVFGYDVEEKQQSIALATKTTFAPESMEATILATCKMPSPFDEIQLKTGLSLLELNEILFSLQLEGHIVQNSVGLWHRTFL
jgi:DNA processing protein